MLIYICFYVSVCIDVLCAFVCVYRKHHWLIIQTACRKNKVPSILSDTYFKEQEKEIKAAQKHYMEV